MNKSIALYANTAFTLLNFREEFIKLLVTENYVVYIICPKDCFLSNLRCNEIKKRFKSLNVNYIPMNYKRNNWNFFLDFIHIFNLFFVLLNLRPNILINYTIKCTLYGSLIGFFCGIKNIYSNITGLGSIISDDSKFKYLRLVILLFYKILLKSNKKIFVQNRDDFNFFSKQKIIAKNKMVLINGSGVNLNKFFYSYSKKQYDFIFIGRILYDKGIMDFVQACNILINNYPKLKIAIIGNFDSNPNTVSKDIFFKSINSINYHYLGFRNDVKKYLLKSKILVLPSKREGTPKSILEAMALKIPVITTNVPGCKEAVRNNYNGILVPYKNINELSIAMHYLLNNKKLQLTYGENGYKLAKVKYDVNVVNKSILDNLKTC